MRRWVTWSFRRWLTHHSSSRSFLMVGVVRGVSVAPPGMTYVSLVRPSPTRMSFIFTSYPISLTA
jgi:hypothetical protein